MLRWPCAEVEAEAAEVGAALQSDGGQTGIRVEQAVRRDPASSGLRVVQLWLLSIASHLLKQAVAVMLAC